MSAELMNDLPEARDAVVAIDWEFVSASADFKRVTPIWLDIDGACSTRGSEVPVPDNGTAKVFSLTMTPPWTSTFSADILWVMSHLHDGGETLQVTRNGVTVCEGLAKYGESEGFVSTSVHEHGGTSSSRSSGRGIEVRHTTKTPHLSSVSSCSLLNDQKVQVQVGDEWSVRANYDFNKHMGGEGPIMGIAMVYVVKN